VHEGPIENSGAIEYYSGRRPVLLDATRSVLGIGATLPESAGIFWDASGLARAWAADRRVFVLTPRGPDKTVLAALPADRVHLLAARDGRWLYGNVPSLRAVAPPARAAVDAAPGAGVPVAAPSGRGIR
jgi:hypothetical protein